MKNLNHMLSTACIAVLFCACNNTENNNVHSAALGGGSPKATLAQGELTFLYNVYAFGIYKIQLAQEAQVRAISPQTIEVAKQVVDAHSLLNARIAEITSKYEVSLPADVTEEQKQTWTTLIKQKGWLFDKTFTTILNSSATNELQTIEKDLLQVKDAGIQSLAGNYTTSLKNEVTAVENIQPLIEGRLNVAPPSAKQSTAKK